VELARVVDMKLILMPLLSLLAFFATLGVDAGPETGSIEGRVVFEGLRPAVLPNLTLGSAGDECSARQPGAEFDATDRRLLLDSKTGGVANVVLTIAGVDGAEKAAPALATMSVRGARFEPHVVVLRAGGSVQIANHDQCCHNLHTYAKRNEPFNRTLDVGESFAVELKEVEVFSARDDTHPWMEAHLFVTDAQAYAVSDSEGCFSLDGLAPGSYAVTWWHETLGRGATQEIEVVAGQVSATDLQVSMRFDVTADVTTSDSAQGELESDGQGEQPEEPVADAADVAEGPDAAAGEGSRIPAPAPGTGHVNLLAVWSGDLPEPEFLPELSEAEASGCVHGEGEALDRLDRSLLVDPASRGVSNVVFFLENDDVAPLVPKEPFRLDQDGCRFEPHVLVVPVGSELAFANSDETPHNVHSFSRKNTPFNRTVAAGDSLAVSMTHAETFEVKCDIHPWMKSYLVVNEASRCGASSSSGRLLLRDVPPGSYAVSWWHESLGKGKLGTIEVRAGEVAELSHELKKSASRRRGGRR
jgi:plastocyanin